MFKKRFPGTGFVYKACFQKTDIGRLSFMVDAIIEVMKLSEGTALQISEGTAKIVSIR